MTAARTSFRINNSFTKGIIDLHCKGYELDFQLAGDTDKLICAEHTFPVSTPYDILEINQYYDQVTHGFKYVHAIETYCGLKGILVADRILFHRIAACDLAKLQKAIVGKKAPADLVHKRQSLSKQAIN
jgi:hypothetical protein